MLMQDSYAFAQHYSAVLRNFLRFTRRDHFRHRYVCDRVVVTVLFLILYRSRGSVLLRHNPEEADRGDRFQLQLHLSR